MIYSPHTTDVSQAERFERIGVTADPRHAARTRDEFGRWVHHAFALEPHRAGDPMLAVYEALANIAEFAYPATGFTGTMDVSARYDPAEGTLSVTVADRGLWRTAPTSPGDRSRGRGIGLMKALTDDASIQTSMHGTTVRLTWTGVHRR